MFDSQSSRKTVVAVGMAVVFAALIFEFVVPTEHVGQLAQSSPAPAAAPTNGSPTVPAQTATNQTQPTDQTVIPPSAPDTAAVAAAHPSSASNGADAQQAAASPGAAGNGPVASDRQITADVKSHIAAAGLHSNVDVTTTNGVVALAGSAPNQDAVDRAKLAAFRVAGVKNVDVSALKVGGPLR